MGHSRKVGLERNCEIVEPDQRRSAGLEVVVGEEHQNVYVIPRVLYEKLWS